MDSSKSSNSSMDSSKWTIHEVAEKIREKYDEEVAEKFRCVLILPSLCQVKTKGHKYKLTRRESCSTQFFLYWKRCFTA